MKIVHPTDVRNQWKSVLRKIADGQEEVLIHLRGDRHVVMLAADVYESLVATLETLSDRDAMGAIRAHRRGGGRKYSIHEIDRLIDAGA